jgi:hypothetical protein
MERELRVSIDLEGAPVPVGRLWARARGNKESASFEYEGSWLRRRDVFGVDREAAAKCRVGKTEIERMASAFEHEDSKAAVGRS